MYRDSRSIEAALKRNTKKQLKPDLKYAEITYCCIHGRKKYKPTSKRKRPHLLYVISVVLLLTYMLLLVHLERTVPVNLNEERHQMDNVLLLHHLMITTIMRYHRYNLITHVIVVKGMYIVVRFFSPSSTT